MRARSLKPGFFKNEELARRHPLARILFAGLWGLADRAGRLEDRPERIKIEVLPLDKVNVSALLDSLAVGPDPFIVRYEINSRRYIQILNFMKHQTPHMREAPSTIPAPDKPGAQHSAEHSARHRQDRLTPDSGLLTPHSLTPGAVGQSTGLAPGPIPVGLWDQVVEKLEDGGIDRKELRTWFGPPRELGLDGEGHLLVEVPSQHFVDWISDRYAHEIDQILGELRPIDRPRLHLVLGAKEARG